jgi:hypothetical protein
LKLFTDKFIQILDKYYDHDNIVMLTYKYLTEHKFKNIIGEDKSRKVKDLLIGLSKTGNIDDIMKNSEIFDVIRIIVKYEMKKRGYSLKKGVMFLGSPDEVKRKILEVVKGLRERVLALYEELSEDVKLEVLKEVKVFSDLERVKAVLEF